MFASANSHVWKKYNEPAMAEGKLVGVRGAVPCGTCGKVPHSSKVTTGMCPLSVPCHPYFSGEGGNLLLVLIETMNITAFQMTPFGPHVSLRNLCLLNLLLENWHLIYKISRYHSWWLWKKKYSFFDLVTVLFKS